MTLNNDVLSIFGIQLPNNSKGINLNNFKLTGNIKGINCSYNGDIYFKDMHVDGSIYLSKLALNGNLYLNNTTIEGDLIIEDSNLNNLYLNNTDINGTHTFKNLKGNLIDISELELSDYYHFPVQLSKHERTQCKDSAIFHTITDNSEKRSNSLPSDIYFSNFKNQLLKNSESKYCQ